MRVVTAVAMALVQAVAFAQAVDQPVAAKPEASAIPVEVFQGPHQKKITPPIYPIGLREGSVEGWVNLSMMIDPAGKPYEVMVSQSSGNKQLEKAALAAADDWQFDPASLDGKPIDSAYELKVKFALTDQEKGATPYFATAYRNLQKAFEAKDRKAADTELARLKISNLYEDAYYGMAQYRYAHLWGTKDEELAGLKRAIAEEKSASYLPADSFALAVEALFVLQIQISDYAGAMGSWRKLQQTKIDPKVLASYQPAVDQMRKLRADDRAYAMSGVLTDGSWHAGLFKRNFRIVVASGHVSQIKLRCDKKYVFFGYDPQLTYRVGDNFGGCGIQIVGDPDTKFQLIQS